MQPRCELANGHFADFLQATFATGIEVLAAVAPGRPRLERADVPWRTIPEAAPVPAVA
jgi:hypothetical protein